VGLVRGRKNLSESEDKYFEFIRRKSCIICGNAVYHEETSEWLCDPAHVRSKGAGGATVGNLVPLCRVHHVEQHKRGWIWLMDHYKFSVYSEAIKFKTLWLSQNARKYMNDITDTADTESIEE